MTFLNEYEIEDAVARLERTDALNLLAAARTLQALVEWVNSHSDGWPYWQAPRKAAARLVALVGSQPHRWNPEDVSDADLRRALTPLKSFLTKHGVDHGLVLREVVR